MEREMRSVRLSADNCPKCNSTDTYLVMATFTDQEKGSGDADGVQVAYRCRACRTSWLTSWGVEYIA